MKLLYSTLLGIALALMAAGCDRQKPEPARQPPQPTESKKTTPPADQTGQANDSKKDANKKTAQKEENGLNNPDKAMSDRLAQEQREKRARADQLIREQQAKTEQAKNSPAVTTPASLMDTLRHAGESVRDQATNAGAYLGSKALAIGESATSAFQPSDDDRRRRESLETMTEDQRILRERNPATADERVKATRPMPLNRVEAVLAPKDEVSALLTSLVTEPDGNRIRPTVDALIDEVFNEPEQARAKILKIQTGLRRLSDASLYSDSVAERVADLQANLDSRIERDESAELLRDSMVIAGSSLALGAVAGFGGFNNAHEWVDAFSLRQALAKTGRGIGSAYKFGRDGVVNVVNVTSRAVGRGASHLWSATLPTAKIAARNLRALELEPQDVESLALQPIKRSDLSFQAFKDTNLPGFKYAVATKTDAQGIEQTQVIFSQARWNGHSLIGTRALSRGESEALTARLTYRSPEQGGKDFVDIVDAETGVATPTRMTMEDLGEGAEGPTVVQGQPQGANDTGETGASTDVVESGSPRALEPTAGPTPPASPSAADDVTAAASPADDASNAAVATEGEASSTAASTEPGAKAQSVRRRKSMAEAQADGDVPVSDQIAASTGAAEEETTGQSSPSLVSKIASTTAGAAKGAGQAIKSGAATVASGTKEIAGHASQAARTTASNVKQTTSRLMRRFDLPWATAVTLGTGVPAYALYSVGYRSGHEKGRGYDSLYLESLIAPDNSKGLNTALNASANEIK